MAHHLSINAHYHLVCDECGTERNEPFCKECHTFDNDVFISLRHNGIEAAAAVEASEAALREGDADTVEAIESGFGIFE